MRTVRCFVSALVLVLSTLPFLDLAWVSAEDEPQIEGHGLTYWLEELQSSKWGRRSKAEKNIRALGEKAVPGLRRLLAQDDVRIQIVAARCLSGMGEAGLPLLDLLCQRLEEEGDRKENTGVGWAARDAIVAIGEPAVDKLMERIDDAGMSHDARTWFTGALSEIGKRPEASIALLARWLDKGDPIHQALTARALGRFGKPAAAEVPRILPLLDQEDPAVQALAAGALAGIGAEPEKVVPSLKKLLASKHARVRRSAALGLVEFEVWVDAMAPALVGWLDRWGRQDTKTRDRIIVLAQEREALGVALEAEIVKPREHREWTLLIAACALFDAGRRSPEMIDELLAWHGVHMGVGEEGGRSNDRAKASLVKAPGPVLSRIEAKLRAGDKASWRLTRLTVAFGAPGIEMLRKFLEPSTDKQLLRHVVGALKEAGPAAKSAVPDLLALLEGADGFLRHELEGTLRKLGATRSRFATAWQSGSARKRLDALRLLDSQEEALDEALVSLLVQGLGDRVYAVREQVSRVLQRRGGASTVRALVALVQGRVEGLRVHAIRILSRLQVDRIDALLAEALSRAEHRDARIGIAQVIVARESVPVSVVRMAFAWISDPHPGLRNTAYHLLQHAEPERLAAGIEALEPLVASSDPRIVIHLVHRSGKATPRLIEALAAWATSPALASGGEESIALAAASALDAAGAPITARRRAWGALLASHLEQRQRYRIERQLRQGLAGLGADGVDLVLELARGSETGPLQDLLSMLSSLAKTPASFAALRAFLDHEDERVSETALRALGGMGPLSDEDARKIESLAYTGPEARAHAARRVLARHGRGGPKLLDHLLDEGGAYHRSTRQSFGGPPVETVELADHLASLIASGPAVGRRVLEHAAKTDDPPLREALVRALGAPAQASLASELAGRIPKARPGMQRAIVAALVGMAGTDADRLMGLRRWIDHADLDIARAAIQAVAVRGQETKSLHAAIRERIRKTPKIVEGQRKLLWELRRHRILDR